MINFSPKIEIINHFDKLISEIEVDIEESIEKYNDKQVIGELLTHIKEDKINYWKKHELNIFDLEFNDSSELEFHDASDLEFNERNDDDLWSESTKVIDYLTQVRKKTIELFRKEQDESLANYRIQSAHFKSQLTTVKNIEEMRSKLFADKFHFQIHFTQSDTRLWPLNVFTFVTDFYMSRTDILLLERLINAEKEPFCPVNSPPFDEKMVLIGLLYNKFIENMLSNFPTHVIRVRKQSVSTISSIVFQHHYSRVNLSGSSTIDLTKLDSLYLFRRNLTDKRESVEIAIEGLSSLKILNLEISSDEINISLRNVNSVTSFGLDIPITIDEYITTQLFNTMPNIEELRLSGKQLSFFKLENLVNLKKLTLQGTIDDNFNFQLFKSLCNQLEELSVCFDNDVKEELFFKLFDGHHFSNLLILDIGCNIKRVNKKFLDYFPVLRELSMNECKLEMIDDDAFSNLKQLVRLDLSKNLLETLNNPSFSGLINLEYLNLSNNKIKCIDDFVFSNLKKLQRLNLKRNRLALLEPVSVIVFPFSVIVYF